jgi:hypothetical protein
MTDLKKAAQQALEALEMNYKLINGEGSYFGLEGAMDGYYSGCFDIDGTNKLTNKTMTALRAALAQEEQEPFGYIWPTGRHPEFRYTQLFTAPPRREWKGLSDTEVLSIHQSLCNTVGSDYRTVARAVEQALKEKNHG